MADAQPALIDLADVGGFGGTRPFGGSHFFRVNNATRSVAWEPAIPIRITGFMIFNVENAIVISRAPFSSNDLNSLPDGASIGGGQILWWSNSVTPSNAAISQVLGVNFKVDPTEGDKIYITYTTGLSGWVIVYFDHLT